MLGAYRQLLRIALARHRAAALVALAASWLGVAVAREATPTSWLARAEVLVTEPSVVYRLTTPFDAVPPLNQGVAQLPDQLTSRAALVALVKRTALVDRWEQVRPWPSRLKAAVMDRLRGPPDEVDRLEALVALLEKRLWVTVVKNKLFISCELPDARLAAEVVRGTVDALAVLRGERDVRALEVVADALDAQRQGVEAEVRRRLEGLEAERREAVAQGRYPDTAAALAQLARDAARRDELLVQTTNARLRAQAMSRSAQFRYVVTKPPLLPREPQGASPRAFALALGVVSLLALLGGAVLGAARSGRLASEWQVERSLGLPVLGRVQAPWGGVMVPATLRTVAPGALLGLAAGLALGASKGQLLAGLAPWAVVAAGVALWRLPLKWPLLALMLLAITVDDPTDRPYFGFWTSPLLPLGRLLFSNVAWFTGFELAVMGLAALTVLKRLLRVGGHEAPGEPGPIPLRAALVVSLATVLWLIVWGMGRGGDFREALWQFRALLFMPVVGWLALAAFEVPGDLRKLGVVLFLGSVVKALLGTYFMYGIAFPQGIYPPHTTGHNDTMIFVIGVVLALVRIWERPTLRHLGEALVWLPFLAMALKLNDRRIAYVDITLVLMFLYFVSPMNRMKRFVTQALVVSLPVLLLYTAVGWNARGGVFVPVVKLRSIVAPAAETEEESSNVERDIENFNLLKSWERDLLFGQGFGHAFTEFIPSNDFAQSNFGHIGHNSVLWLLWIGGIFGFFGVWLYVAIAAYFFARTLHLTDPPLERIGLWTAMAVLITYLLQAFGDMGTQSMQFAFFVSTALAVIGRTASRHGAWQRRPQAALAPADVPAQAPGASPELAG